MKAREMFEKLGYEQRVNNESHIVYMKYEYLDFNKSKEYIIEFHNKDKSLEKFSEYTHIHLIGSETIKIKELQAINKQIEELGWNK